MSEQCPFCPVLLPDEPQAWGKTGGDFFGGNAKIGNIAACDSCAVYAWVANCEEMMVRDLLRERTSMEAK